MLQGRAPQLVNWLDLIVMIPYSCAVMFVSYATVHKRKHWIAALSLVVLLGAQLLQATHVHAEVDAWQDCHQCQLDSGNGHVASKAAPVDSADSVVTPVGAILAAAVSINYRRSARGPPYNS